MSRNKKRSKINEARFSSSRFGFMGTGFGGKSNTYDPYKSIRESEEETGLDIETREDAWSGGDNLEAPTDYVKVYHGLDTVREPERLDHVMTEKTLRKIIREALKKGLK